MIEKKVLEKGINLGHTDSGICSPSDQPQGLRRGIVFLRGYAMPPEPSAKRVMAFVDGQNLFYATKVAFGCQFPNYDPKLPAESVSALKGWILKKVHYQ